MQYQDELQALQQFSSGLGLSHSQFRRCVQSIGLLPKVSEVKEVLHMLGVCRIDDNPVLCSKADKLKHCEWDTEEKEKLLNATQDAHESLRTLFQHRAFAIDSADTSEVDDAVSLTSDPDGTEWIHIHSADLTRYVPETSAMHQVASKRARTHYLPEGVWPMLPSELGAAASLQEDKSCPALTCSLALDNEGAVLDYRVHLTAVSDVRRITYQQAESVLEAENIGWASTASCEDVALPDWFESSDAATLRRLAEISLVRQEHRARHGARKIEKLGRKVKLLNSSMDYGAEPEICLGGSDSAYPASRWLIQELMLLAGYVAATYAVQHNIVVPFRCDQLNNVEGPPDVVLVGASKAPEDELREDNFGIQILKSYQQLEDTNKAGYSLTPLPHRSVAFDRYLQVTSPIRRYNDMLAHYQLKEHLLKGASQPLEWVESFTTRLNELCDETVRMQNMSQRHWLLHGLKNSDDVVYDCIILSSQDTSGSIYDCQDLSTPVCLRVLLLDFGLIVALWHDVMLNPGTVAQCTLAFIDPAVPKVSLTLLLPTLD